MSAPIVSVCLPVYNGESFLAAAIESVLAQTEPDFELLICDDASTDNSKKIIEEYAIRDSRIKYWSNDSNIGLFENYNRCFKEATGEYLKPFAQDDVLAPAMLNRSIAILDQNQDVSLVAVRREIIDNAGKDLSEKIDVLHFDDIFPAFQSVRGDDVIAKSLMPVVNFIGEPACTMFRANSTAAKFDTSFHHLGDLDLWLRLLQEGNVYFIADALCKFRIHETARSNFNTKTLLFMVDHMTLGSKFKDKFESSGFTQIEFFRKNVRALSDHVKSDSLSVEVLREQRDCLEKMYKSHNDSEIDTGLLVDSLAFRELAFLALLEANEEKQRVFRLADSCGLNLSSTESLSEVEFAMLVKRRDKKQIQLTIKNNQDKINKLEAKLRHLMSSSSWKITKVLRDWNSVLATLTGTKSEAMSKFSGLASEIDKQQERLAKQETYIKYLSKQVRSIKNSRSWMLSSPLRSVSKLLGRPF